MPTESAARFAGRQIERLRNLKSPKRIVFPEGDDPRVREAAARLQADGWIEPVLLTNSEQSVKYTELYYQRRRTKGVTMAEAREIASHPLYRAALMVAAGDADGGIGGAVNTTAETARAAIQCIGLAPRISTISGVFFMCVDDRGFGHDGVLAFADCAMVVEPTAVEIAEIAIETARSVRSLMGVEPRVALLSFSTKGSARHPSIDRMSQALEILRERAPEIDADGEMQVDAALVESIGQSKSPGSSVAGRANTLIFPDLASANIAYKLVERLGGASAYGPFLQGLAQPFNDLSRGCSEEDIYVAALVTALQCEGNQHAAV